jgi:hypothetical protein
LRVENNGDIVWDREFNDINAYEFTSIRETFDGGFVAAGSIRQAFGTLVVKLSSSGDTLWTRYLEDVQGDGGKSVLELADSTIAVFSGDGCCVGPNTSLSILTMNGDLLWIQDYGWDQLDWARKVIGTPNQGFYLVGSSNRLPSSELMQFYILETDAVGDTLRSTFIGEEDANFWLHDATLTSQNNLVLVGWRETIDGDQSEDYVVIGVDSSGNQNWTRYFGSDHLDIATGVCPVTLDGVLVCGNLSRQGGAFSEPHLVRLNEEGDTVWQTSLPIGLSSTYAKVSYADGSIVVCGSARISDLSDPDLLIVKYEAQSSLNDIQDISKNRLSFSVYPNPVNGFVNIRADLNAAMPATLLLYDVLGRRVKSFNATELIRNSFTTTLNVTDFPTGIYYIQLRTTNATLTRKISIVR